MTSTRFSVSWDSHKKNICDGLSFLQQHGEFVDMTLAADGHHVQVHKMIMSLVSPYIKDIITSTQCTHPVIFLHNMSYNILQSVLEYVYTGEVTVPKDEIRMFLDACNSLQIKGLNNYNQPGSSDITQNVTTESAPQLYYEYTTEKKITSIEKDDHKEKAKENITSVDSTLPLMTDDLEFDMDNDDQSSIEEDNRKDLKTSGPENQIVQYTVSNQGTLQLILNRFIYFLRYRRIKNKEIVWYCVNYRRKCPALVITKGNKVIKRERAHNHPYHDKRILKCVNSGKVFSVITDAETKCIEIKIGKKDDSTT